MIWYLNDKYDQIHVQLHTRSQLTTDGEAKADQRATTNYQEWEAGKMINNQLAQIELAKREADSRQRASSCTSVYDSASGSTRMAEQDDSYQEAQEEVVP